MQIAYSSVKWRTSLARTGEAGLQLGRQNHQKDQTETEQPYVKYNSGLLGA